MIKLDPIPTQDQINALMLEGAQAYQKNMSPKSPYGLYSDEARLWLRGYSNTKAAQKLNNLE